MRKNRSNRRSHRRSRRHHKTARRHRRGGNTGVPSSSLYKPVSAVAKEPVLLADQVGKSVSDTLKSAQVSLIQGQYKAKEQTRKVTDAVKGFGERITGAFKSLFGGSRKSRRRARGGGLYNSSTPYYGALQKPDPGKLTA
jgi:hypothetical protein